MMTRTETEQWLEARFSEIDLKELLFNNAKRIVEDDFKYGGVFDEPIEPQPCKPPPPYTALTLWKPIL